MNPGGSLRFSKYPKSAGFLKNQIRVVLVLVPVSKRIKPRIQVWVQFFINK
jgi:hypothetical protein